MAEHTTSESVANPQTGKVESTLAPPGTQGRLGMREETASAPAFPAPDIPSFTWGGYLQGIGLMFLLLAGLWFLARLLRRYGRFNFIPRQGSLDRDAFFMEAQMPVGPRKSLMVVRFMKRRLLLGVSDQKISLLTEERVDDDGEDERSFEHYLESAGDKDKK